MVKRFAIFISLLALGSLLASNVIVYDPQSAGVTNRVTAYLQSVDTGKYSGQSNTLINPVVPNGVATDWKVSGTNVVGMDSNDLAAIAASDAATVAAKQAAQQRQAKTNVWKGIDDYLEDGRTFRAFAELVMDELNILRGQVQLARTNTTAFQSSTNRTSVPLGDRTTGQLRSAMINKLNAQGDTAP
jgi:ribosomal protein S11